MDHEHAGLPIDPDLEPDDPAAPSREHRPAPRGAHRGRSRRVVLPAVAVGGAVGASARWAVGDLWPTPDGSVPWGTVAVNVAGALLLGVLIVVMIERLPGDHLLRPFLAAGILGSFTTMSAFQVETAELLRDGHAAAASANVALTLVLGLAAAAVGLRIGRMLVGAAVPHR